MKLSEIEEVGYLLTAYDEEDVYEDGDINYDVFEFHRDNYTQNDLNKCGLTQWDFCDCQALYTKEQAVEFAKAQVAEALKACLQIKIPGRCNGKTAMIAEQFKNIIDSIFEEKEKMNKKISVTCEKCKESFIFTSESSVVDKVLDEGHYICFTCEDEKSEDTKND